MKAFLFLICFTLLQVNLYAAFEDSITVYHLPDSVKAVSIISQVSVSSHQLWSTAKAGIQTDKVRLYLSASAKGKSVVFEFPASSLAIVNGIDVHEKGKSVEWQYEWSVNTSYQLLIATASDSAGNFSLFSGYIFLPEIHKWKLLGTCKILGTATTLKGPASFVSANERNGLNASFNDAQAQRSNGSWKKLTEDAGKTPVVNLMSHADSLQQIAVERSQIESDIRNGKTSAMEILQGIYYSILKEGTGALVSLEDTVTVFYKGYLYATNEVFDQTKDKPATFPLKRLITGWQIGLPQCREGGKIKLVIPSALAYSIRTRAAKIPPNSTLVFEIEVVKTKKPRISP